MTPESSATPPGAAPATGPVATAPSARPLARAALALYPPSWRARYGDEVCALLDEAGPGNRATMSLAWHALPAWVWPARHLHDRPARMRSSLATALVSGSVLAGLALVFGQLTQLQGLRSAAHPVIGWSYTVFDVALAAAGLVAAVGGLPLWLLMLRRASRGRRPRDVLYLLLPFLAPAGYLAVLFLTLPFLQHPHGVGPWTFLVITLGGLAAAVLASAGPGQALRRLGPRGPALRLAATAAGLAAAIMVVAGAAIIVAVAGLSLWVQGFGGYHEVAAPGAFLALVAGLAGVTAVSATRGVRAARADRA